MIDYDDYFGGLTREEYEKETEEHFKFMDHICKCDYDKAFALIDKYKYNLFASEFVSDEEAEMLYHTILNWKEKSEMYDDLCDQRENKYMSDISTLITNEIRNTLENLSRKGVGFINLETTDAIQYQIDNRIFDITVKEQDR